MPALGAFLRGRAGGSASTSGDSAAGKAHVLVSDCILILRFYVLHLQNSICIRKHLCFSSLEHGLHKHKKVDKVGLSLSMLEQCVGQAIQDSPCTGKPDSSTRGRVRCVFAASTELVKCECGVLDSAVDRLGFPLFPPRAGESIIPSALARSV